MKKQTLKDLKAKQTDREKIISWLDHIQEFDEACRNEVLEQCSKDTSARSYYVQRYEECVK